MYATTACCCNMQCICSDDVSVLQSEYSPASQERRHYITRFTGSAGTAVVTPDTAALWTDGRYFLQVRSSSRPFCSLTERCYCAVQCKVLRPKLPHW